MGKNTKLTTGCIIGAKCELTCCETIPENTVIFGENRERRLQAEKPPVSFLTHFNHFRFFIFIKFGNSTCHKFSSSFSEMQL